MIRRPHVERLPSGAYRVRVADPFDRSKRLSIADPSETAVLARLEAVLAVKRDLKFHAIGEREARRAISRAVYGAPMVLELWTDYVQTLRGNWAIKVGGPKGSDAGIWKTRLAPYFEGARVWDLTAPVMAQWEKSELAKGISPKTIENAYQCLRAAIRQAIPERVTEIPWRSWRPLGAPRGALQSHRGSAVSLADCEAIVRAAMIFDAEEQRKRATYCDRATQIVVALMLGLRQGELAALGWDCLLLDQDRPKVLIHYAAKPNWKRDHPDWERPRDAPKGHWKAEAPIASFGVRTLKAHRQRLIDLGLYRPDGPVFPGKAGEYRRHPWPIKPEAFRKIVELAGFENPERWTPHSLRHSFATQVAKEAFARTGDIKEAMRETRHRSVKVIMNYLHTADVSQAESLMPAFPASLPLPGMLVEAPQPCRSCGGAPGFHSGGCPDDPATLGAQSEALAVLGEAAASAMTIETRGAKAPAQKGERFWEESEMALSPLELAAKYCHGETPRVIFEKAERHYSRAYAAELRRQREAGTVDVERCKTVARLSRRGFMLTWRKLCKAARKAAEKGSVQP